MSAMSLGSAMTLEELGQAIKEKREAAGMSLDDVAARIKVSARILRAIEEGSLVGLPHAVYTKSFIRSFGQLVGYDPQELKIALEELFPPGIFDESKVESVLRANPVMTYADAGKRFSIILLLLALIAGVIGGSWYVVVTYGDQIIEAVKVPFSAITSEEKREQQPVPFRPAESPQGTGSSLSGTLSVLTAQSSPSGGQVLPSRAAPPSGDSPVVPAPTATNDSPAFAGVNAFNSENMVETSTPQPNDDTVSSQELNLNAGLEEEVPAQAVDDDINVNMEASTPGGKNRLVVRVDAECWIRSRADTGIIRDYTVHPGMHFAITYNDRLEMTFGNAGGVRLFHNDRELGPPGGSGRVVTVRFPAQ